MRTTLLLLGAATTVLYLGGCEGPSGAEGPKGDAGAEGSGGQEGSDGADGADGDDGQNGSDGTPGDDGLDGHDGHSGDAPWGVNLEVLSLEGASGTAGQWLPGDIPVVTYQLLDDRDVPYDLDELTGLQFQIAGPVQNYQIAVYASDLSDTRTASVDNRDGTYTYTFLQAIPDVYHTVPNDTTDLDADDGDLGGTALVEGTYTFASWAYIRQYRQDGSYYYDAGNVTQDILLGETATAVEAYEVVLAENCANCHGDSFYAHGGSRRDIQVCQTCHVDGAEDRYSATDGTTTPGATVGWNTMIHKIHMGENLTNGYVANGYPSSADVEGYPNYNAYDYGDVAFPRWPLGPAHCDSCHEGAADGDVYSVPTRQACGACHDAVDFATGDGHDGGAQADDSLCTVCHGASATEGYHIDKRDDPTFNAGFNVDVTAVYNQDGATTFQVGDTITVQYTVTDDAGANLSNALWAYSSTSSTCGVVSGGANVIFTGPSEHMTRVIYSASQSSTTTVGSLYGSSTYDSTTGVYTYSFTNTDSTSMPIPATYGAQYYNTDTFGLADGDWYGEALVGGTYRVGMDIYTNLYDDDCVKWRVADSDYEDVLVGDVTTLEPREVIDESGCENCHTTIEFHGSGKVGVNYCIMCHTVGAEDTTSANTDTTIDFPVLIHKLHASSELENEFCAGSGNCYDVTFPRLDGGVMACEGCHGENDAWKDPSTRGCVTCHDSDDAVAHAALMTDQTYGETCDVCHGEGRDFSAETMHDWLR